MSAEERLPCIAAPLRATKIHCLLASIDCSSCTSNAVLYQLSPQSHSEVVELIGVDRVPVCSTKCMCYCYFCWRKRPLLLRFSL